MPRIALKRGRGGSCDEAMPKRKPESQEPFGIVHQPCLMGGGLRGLEVLPVEELCGVSCIALNAYAPWMNMALEGKSRGDHQGLVVSTINELFNKMKRPSSSSEEEVQDAAPAAPAKVLKGRAALGMDSDSDEEALAEATVSGSKRSYKTGLPRASSKTFHTIDFHGLELTVKRRARGGGVVMQLSSLPIFLTYLREKITESAASAARVPKKPKNTEMELRTDEDRGRVQWVFSHHGWRVKYETESGHVKTSMKNLIVPCTDFDGRVLSVDEFADMRKKLLWRARNLWNEWDCSDAARFDIPEEHTS